MTITKIILLETVLDHLTGEEVGHALEKLNSMDTVLDAVYLPGIGKKNRPCGLLQVMCRPGNEAAARDAMFRHTHALGLRRLEMERYELERHASKMELAGHEAAAKIHILEGEEYERPEADAASAIADKLHTGSPALRFARKERKE